MPQPLPPKMLPEPPQQNKRRIIQRQLLSPHPPQPLPFPQNKSIKMSQRQLLPLPSLLLAHPHPHPFPQLVAAKSLILFPPKIFDYTTSYDT